MSIGIASSASATSTCSTSSARATAVPASLPTPISKARTPRFIRTSSRTPTASSASSASSAGPMEFPATWLRRPPAPSTKAASWATRWCMPIGAAFDNPDLIVACVVGDGEAETGPLATSWHSNKFLNPATDGAVLPDPPSQRLQDRQPNDSGAHSSRRARRPDARLRL